ncbi:MAG: methylated-DNA--[protein]-cysteine S-methyltransferase [Candidatus Eremiobacteraeota bacterium]|nr:methylated-DNA--[protein]-cysteine S-methyltransferase [Candidatus Eremiobacteraeota bacterium]
MFVFCGTVRSPIGAVSFLSDEAALRALAFVDEPLRLIDAHRRRHGDVRVDDRRDALGIAHRIEAYFSGDIVALDAIPVAVDGTPFQTSVWYKLREISPGSTTTYGAIARGLGAPAATRAVGAANGANPISLVLPCHRVIGENGTLTGYGAGLPRKAWLLRHEGLEIVESPKGLAHGKVSNELRLLQH